MKRPPYPNEVISGRGTSMWQPRSIWRKFTRSQAPSRRDPAVKGQVVTRGEGRTAALCCGAAHNTRLMAGTNELTCATHEQRDINNSEGCEETARNWCLSEVVNEATLTNPVVSAESTRLCKRTDIINNKIGGQNTDSDAGGGGGSSSCSGRSSVSLPPQDTTGSRTRYYTEYKPAIGTQAGREGSMEARRVMATLFTILIPHMSF
ncbi:hypothetical protein E2C01_055350 [Portunus trituberculatus]|uniref:Uncharacterized protein n=1 Tax=Portunus trituberculatus TaxID=210409 RepID=A0A5B7GMH1_PORTR|nr:hypothetical protein [Portunus trituberculatus]